MKSKKVNKGGNEKMAAGESSDINFENLGSRLSKKKAEKEQLINDVLSESIQRVANFYLHILKELNKPDGVSFLGPTEYPEPYFGISESGARLNFVLEIKEKGLVVCKTLREGKAYRHTYKIVEECRESMKEFLEKLGL